MALDVDVFGVSGAEWLDRLTFDVFCHVLLFLDVRSISTLASTCEAFQQVITESKIIWLRVLRILSEEQSVVPRSLEHLTSVSDLRAAATRWLRIRAALKNHDLPMSIRIDQYRLDHSEIFSGASPTLTPPTLLPGGRWLLGSATHDDNSYLICWDVQQKVPIPRDATQPPLFSLQPAQHMQLGGGFTIQWYRGSWAKIQATPDADGVVIAVRASNNRGVRIHRIIELTWSDHTSPPTFVLRAKLDSDARYIDDGGRHPYALQGDYLAIDSFNSIFIWNWKDDTVCTVSDHDIPEWAGNGGFWMSLQPPFIFVFPSGNERIVPIRIPRMVGRNSYTGPSTPIILPHIPFGHSGNSPPTSLNYWQPSRLQPGIDVVHSHGFNSDHIIRFNLSPAEDQVAPLRSVEQARWIFKDIVVSSINVVGPDGDALACEFLRGGLGLKVDAFPQRADGSFSPAHSRIWDIFELGWADGVAFAGPMCPVSGTVLLDRRPPVGPMVRGRRAPLARPGAKIVAVVSFY